MTKKQLPIFLVFIFGCTHTPSIYKEQGKQSVKSNIQDIINSVETETTTFQKDIISKTNDNSGSYTQTSSKTYEYNKSANTVWFEAHGSYKLEVASI